MAFFAWITVTIFDDIKDVDPVTHEAINKGFDTLAASLNSMFVAGATEDFTFIFMPTYTAYRQTGMLWLVFLVIVQVLLLNLVLDTLVGAYMTYTEKEEEKITGEKVLGIQKVFFSLGEATGQGEM